MTKAQIKRRIKKIFSFFHRIKLKNKDFSILSNNCWGGVVYDRYSMEYLTPTIGLWIPPADYIKFLSNLDYYLKEEMTNINYKESHVCEMLVKRKKEGRYSFDLNDLIIGRIHDVDIIFIHYRTFEEAKSKWDRRKKRINYNNLLVKMNDQNSCSETDFDAFLKLSFENKIFFTSNKKWKGRDNVVFIKKYEKHGYVLNDTRHGDVPLNITKLLNSMIR